MLKIVAAIEYTINCDNNFLRGRKRAIVYCFWILLNFKKYHLLKIFAVFWISMQISISLLFLEFERGKRCFSCEIDVSKSLPFFWGPCSINSVGIILFLPLQCLQCISSWESCVSLQFGRTFWRQIGGSQLPGNVGIVLISADRGLWLMCDRRSSWADWTQAT